MAGANFFIQNNVTSTSDSHSRWKFIKDSGDNWTLTLPKNFGAALYTGVFVKDNDGNNIAGLSEGVNAVSSDPTIVSVSNIGGHGFQLSSKGVVGTCYLTVTIPGTPGSVIPDGMTEVVRITTTNLAVADWQNMSPILEHFAGAQLAVSGFSQYSSGVSVSAGASVDATGEKYVEIHDGDVLSSTGARILVQRKFDISVSAGDRVNVAGRLGASYLLVDTDEIADRYLKDESGGVYTLYLLTSQHEIDLKTAARPGEPDVGLQHAEVASGDSVEVQVTGPDTFRLNALKTGESQVQLDGGSDGATTYINVIVLDEYPDTVLVKNGSQVTVADPEIIVVKPVILNNNVNNVNVTGLVILGSGEDIHVSQHVELEVSKETHLVVVNGTRVIVPGEKVMSKNLRIDNGTNVQINGSVIWSDDITLSAGSSVQIVDGHVVNVSAGTHTDLFGWKEQPHHEIVVNGAKVEIKPGQIIVNAATISTRNGSSAHVGGQKPADILVSYRGVTSVFRGMQVEKSSIIVENPATVVLTGTAFGGTIPDVATPYLLFPASIVPGREFVKGQFVDIPHISLDSSIRLGVKLYSYDNTLLNPTTFTSAYFTFDDDLQLFANIDPEESTFNVLAAPADMAGLARKKVYDMSLHVVDKQGNPSIVLTRKLRFI